MKIKFKDSKFKTQEEACNVFNASHPTMHSEALLREDETLSICCLHLYADDKVYGWGNVVLDDENIIIETNETEAKGYDNFKSIMMRPISRRLIFANFEEGGEYIFMGLYLLDKSLSLTLKALTWRRLTDEVDVESILKHTDKNNK